MRLNPAVESYRVPDGEWGTKLGNQFGLFYIPIKSHIIKVIICDGLETGWEHVSASLSNRCPNWEEMSRLKDLFFDEDETVVQFHPRKSEYVNVHPYCLHLWRRVGIEMELPPKICV